MAKQTPKWKKTLDDVPLLSLDSLPKPELSGLNEKTKTTKDIAAKVAIAKKKLQEMGGLPNHYHVVNDVLTLGEISRKISSTKRFSFDTETNGLNPWRPSTELYCVSIFVDGHSYLINFKHPLLPKTDLSTFRQQLGSYFSDPDVERRSFNIGFDAGFMEEKAGVPCGYLTTDPGAALWLLDERVIGRKPNAPGLKELCEFYLGFDAGGTYNEQFGKTAWIVIDPLVAAYYACKDAELHDQLSDYTAAELGKIPSLQKIFLNVEMPALNVLYNTTKVGLPVDEEHLPRLGATLQTEIDKLRCELDALVVNLGQTPPQNWGSDDEVADLFYKKLRLPQKRGNSVDKSALDFLAKKTPIVAPLKKLRTKTKLKSAFVDAIPEFIVNGRIHPPFRVTGSHTGRGTCNYPNLYQMPVKGEGVEVRKAYIAPEGYYLVSKDFSGQELCLQAELSQDAALIDILLKGGDIYAETAAIYYGGTASEYTKHGPKAKFRDISKIVVLGLSYGGSAALVVRAYGGEFKKAQQFVDAFYRRFPDLKHWQERTIESAKKLGYVETLIGRRRHLDFSVEGLSYGEIKELERYAVNSPNQGSAADQTKLALIACAKHFKTKGCKSYVLFPIHDEILFAIEEWEFHNTTILQEIDYIMVNVLPVKSIKFTTSTEVYKRWGEVLKFDTTPSPPEELEAA